MDRYIGLDAHSSSCTVAVIGPSGKRLASYVVETNAKALVQILQSIPKDRHLCLEEEPLAGWLYEILAPHVQEIVVIGVRSSRGPKSDKRDAFALAEMLRIGAVPTRVYKRRGSFTRLAYLANAYRALVGDSVRVQNRLKSLMRSRGVPVSGRHRLHQSWSRVIPKKLPVAARPMAEFFYSYDYLGELREQAQTEMIAEARKHAEFRCVRSCPGLGDVRTALILPIVVTPYRFPSKRTSGRTVGWLSSRAVRPTGCGRRTASG